MKDRVSGSGGYNTVNGAKRYGVYDSATAESPTRYEFLRLEDNPTEVGTPLDKANLLTDATAEHLGLDANATVNDALANAERVGHVTIGGVDYPIVISSIDAGQAGKITIVI